MLSTQIKFYYNIIVYLKYRYIFCTKFYVTFKLRCLHKFKLHEFLLYRNLLVFCLISTMGSYYRSLLCKKLPSWKNILFSLLQFYLVMKKIANNDVVLGISEANYFPYLSITYFLSFYLFKYEFKGCHIKALSCT